MADWNALMQAPNAGASFANAFQNAQQMAEHQQDRQRLAQQDQQAQMAQYREGIVQAGQIIRSIKAKNPQLPDDQVYTAAHQMAVQMRLPGAEHAPAQFDPQYYQQLMAAADAFDPQAAQQGKDIPVQAGGSVLHVNPDGTSRWTIMPAGDAPPPLTDDQIRQMGGQAGQPSPGGFPR